MKTGNPPRRVVSPEHSVEMLMSILRPVARQVAEVRAACDGIVIVTHRPRRIGVTALSVLGLPFKRNGTTVVGVTCDSATAALGHDPVTRRWTSAPPRDAEIKVFLFVDEGTALLTLTFDGDGTIKVKKESDLHVVPAQPSSLNP